MKSEKLFDQAVQLAAAFIANGDIRLERGSTRSSSNALLQLSELIPALHQTLQRSRDLLVHEPDPP